MASKADAPPVEPPCPKIQEPGAPIRVGEGFGHIVSHKLDPDKIVPPDPNAPKRQY
jgi:hypothetical protein